MQKRMCCDVPIVNPTQAAQFWATQIKPNWLRWLPGNRAMMTTLWKVTACQLISTNTHRGAKQYSPTDLKWDRSRTEPQASERKKKQTDVISQMQRENVSAEEAEGSRWPNAVTNHWENLLRHVYPLQRIAKHPLGLMRRGGYRGDKSHLTHFSSIAVKSDNEQGRSESLTSSRLFSLCSSFPWTPLMN